MFRGENWGGGVTWEDISMEKLLVGEENFNALISLEEIILALFEKTRKKNMKSFFY